MKSPVPPWRRWAGGLARELLFRMSQLGLLGYRHRLEPLGPGAARAIAVNQPIIDLDLPPLVGPVDVRLISHPYRHSSLPGYPSLEIWTELKAETFSQAVAYQRIQSHTLRRYRCGPDRRLEGRLAVFPHLTSHFGHFVGDGLGAILWFAADPRITAGGRRLLVTSPSPAWSEALRQLCPRDSLELLRPEQMLEAPLRLHDALVLPRLSSWQNLSLARDLLGAALEEGVFAEAAAAARALPGEKLLLTSGRPERIANLEMVRPLFEHHGYTLLDPRTLAIAELLARLRNARQLWCEHGSMVLNALLCRTRPYRVLALEGSRHDPAASFLGGGLYNGFQRALLRPFPCLPADPSPLLDRQVHPYQRQLRLDPVALEAALSGESGSLG